MLIPINPGQVMLIVEEMQAQEKAQAQAKAKIVKGLKSSVSGLC